MRATLDDLFEELYGFRPKKKGQAYEMLAAAVCKLLNEKMSIFHDKRLKGLFSQTWYQLDVLLQQANQSYFGEAKDYTERKKKVGRDDLQKLAGALKDLPIDGGIFFSATDYTDPAKKYAASSEQMNGKAIDLLHVRRSVEKDENGRIKEIRVSFHFPILLLDQAKAEAVISAEGKDKITKLAQGLAQTEKPKTSQDLIIVEVDWETILNKDGQPIISAYEILSDHPAQAYGSRHFASKPTPGGHAKANEELIPIHGIIYDIPIEDTVFVLSVTADGRPMLLVRNEQGTIDLLITDTDLKRIEFIDEGSVRIKGF